MLKHPFLVAWQGDVSLIAKEQEADAAKTELWFEAKKPRISLTTKLNRVMVSKINFILRIILSKDKEHESDLHTYSLKINHNFESASHSCV